MISRRGLLGALPLLVAAPAIVRASSLMPVKTMEASMYWYTLRRWNPAWSDWMTFSLGSYNRAEAWEQAELLMREWRKSAAQDGTYQELLVGHFSDFGEPIVPSIFSAAGQCDGSVRIERVAPFTGMLRP